MLNEATLSLDIAETSSLTDKALSPIVLLLRRAFPQWRDCIDSGSSVPTNRKISKNASLDDAAIL